MYSKETQGKKGNHSNEIPKICFMGMHVSSQILATIFGPKIATQI
jgi:hypothetical protein